MPADEAKFLDRIQRHQLAAVALMFPHFKDLKPWDPNYKVPRTAWGKADLQGVWSTASLTALTRGGLQGAVMNAAEEVAFHAFVAGRIGFLAMADIAEAVMDRLSYLPPASSMDDVFAADEEARRVAAGLI